MKDLAMLEKDLNINFTNKDLLTTAFVHRSYLNENPSFHLPHNERLEFLGDAVLELIVTEYLYATFDQPEGDLTNWRASLVNAKMLAQIARDLEFNDYLYLSRGESKDGQSKARDIILANAIEAFIGALYLDQGYEVTKEFVASHILTRLPRVLETGTYIDPKSKFQEKAQELYGITPGYTVLEESGPDHAKKFKVSINLGDEQIATGTGSSKQEAQVNAAEKALKKKEWE